MAVIFLAELDQHLSAFEVIMSKLHDSGLPTSELLQSHQGEFLGKFHVIKGGAGFLQLNIISSAAGRGETMFKAQITAADAPAVVDSLKDILQILAQERIELARELTPA